jgi:hypothetical protein
MIEKVCEESHVRQQKRQTVSRVVDNINEFGPTTRPGVGQKKARLKMKNQIHQLSEMRYKTR